jgi:hypothetical protein
MVSKLYAIDEDQKFVFRLLVEENKIESELKKEIKM